MEDSTRPIWEFELTETQVKNLSKPVINITHHWEMTGDTSTNWMEFHGEDHKRFRTPPKWSRLFNFAPDYRSLITPNYRGIQALKVLRDIAAWERQNIDDIAELKRLQEKLGLKTKET
jgi:hypothetical protein